MIGKTNSVINANSNLGAGVGEVLYFEAKSGYKSNAICSYTHTANTSEKLTVFYSLCYSDSRSIVITVNGSNIEIPVGENSTYIQYGQLEISLNDGDILSVTAKALNNYSLSSSTLLITK